MRVVHIDPRPGTPDHRVRTSFAYDICARCIERIGIEVMNREQLAAVRHPELDPLPVGWSWDDGGPYA